MMLKDHLYWVNVDGARCPMHYSNDGVAWIARDAFGPYSRATAEEMARAVPAAHGHWGQPMG